MERALLWGTVPFPHGQPLDCFRFFLMEMFKRMWTEGAQCRPRPQSEAEQASSPFTPSLAEICPRHPFPAPPGPLVLVTGLPSRPVRALSHLTGGHTELRGLWAIWLVGVQDPAGLPKLLSILCSHLAPWIGATPSDIVQAYPSGETWAGRQARGHPRPHGWGAGGSRGLR